MFWVKAHRIFSWKYLTMDSINPQLLVRDDLDGIPQGLASCRIQHPSSSRIDPSSIALRPHKHCLDKYGELTRFQDYHTISFLETSSLIEYDQTISNPDVDFRTWLQRPDCPLDYFTTAEHDELLNFNIPNEYFIPQSPTDQSQTTTFSELDFSQFTNEAHLSNAEDPLPHQEWQSPVADHYILQREAKWSATSPPLPSSHTTSNPPGPEAREPDDEAKAKRDDKRERNKVASTRFRIRSKERQDALAKLLADKTSAFHQLESRMRRLQLENVKMREQLVNKRRLKGQEGQVKRKGVEETRPVM
ncbi:hypothetical protein BKA64DRAFT_764967 [Cadophora sp. MPI-SDFR-AT-0126]|nr:hypothetical protein BKA64DRAFT_764967 [Leotiomycetes sp. MPI-SDFR-AT-0126]